MKITYIKLQGFCNIKTAMSADEIEIDFTKSKNKIILITGPNGGGKTSLLSCLHPFPQNGNLDVRSDNPLVEIGKQGYKEIHYQNGLDSYIIKHFYNPLKESHTVKSYIEKNGNELNPNGNQHSFKDLVREELSIEPDYLKLVRLGNNVTNFIDHKATERKNFMGKILSEVDIYLQFFKTVNKAMIEQKSIISHLVDKIDKLKIPDIEDEEKKQKKLKERIDGLKEEIATLQSDVYVWQYKLSEYDSLQNIRYDLADALQYQKKLDKAMSRKTVNITSLQSCIEELENSVKSQYENNLKLSSAKETRSNLMDQYDSLLKERDAICVELRKVSESEEVIATEKAIDILKARILTKTKDGDLLDIDFAYTAKELEELIVTLDKCNDILYTTYEFGKEPIKKAISFILDKTPIGSYVENHKKSVVKNKLQSMCEYVFNQLSGNKVPNPKCKDSNKCPVFQFYDKLADLAMDTPDEIVEDETFITYTKLSHQNISTILRHINEHQDIVKKLPDNIKAIFKLDEIFGRMENLQPIYDKTLLYGELAKVTEYELLEEDRKNLKSLNEKLRLLKASLGNTDYFNNRLKTLDESIESIVEDISDVNQKIEAWDRLVTEYEVSISQMNELKESFEKKDEIDSKVKTLTESRDEVSKIYEIISKLEDSIRSVQFQYNKLEKEYNQNQFNIESYRTYRDDLDKCREYYDDMKLVKNSLSSKEGIPLLFIQIYLKNIQEITNELLDVIYGDDLYIEDFNISADEFKIPFVTKGTAIRDVSYASQGEKSFISLALSFALISQAISSYNILLLDEIDATLDTRNREKFLQVLERQIDMIDGEQIFVISHNNMFNAYPVDIINTLNEEGTENRLASYLKIEKK